MKVVALHSIKGGVGKTTGAVNLAHEAARSGARVLLWDLDPQGAATFFFRVKPVLKGGGERLVRRHGELASHIRGTDHPALHVVPADFSLRHLDLHLDGTKRPTERLGDLLRPLADDYDVAVLDCPPGITLTSECVFAAADVLLVPTIPTTLSERTLDQLSAFLATRPGGPTLLPYVSMFDRRKTLQRDVVAALVAERPELLATHVPSTSAVERMGIERRPVATFAPSAVATIAFRGLWDEVARRLWP
jgi:chromosome partitioning protein